MVAYGDTYRGIARVCAKYFKTHNPGMPVRLYSDAMVSDDLFDEVRVLEDVWLRSKIDAMIDSPFDRTLYIDVDALAVLDIRDGFDVLDTHDLALCHDQWRNHPNAVTEDTRFVPNAYPQYNSGLLFYRRSPEVLAFLADWRERVRSSGATKDQPALRELAFAADLRVAVLPLEYNVGHRAAFVAHRFFTAPRVIHAATFYRDPTYVTCPYPILRYLGPRNYARFLKAVGEDHYVRRSGSLPAYATYGRNWSVARRLLSLKRLHYLMERSARGTAVPSWALPRNLNVI